jgi:hypothetical protein
MESIGKAHTSAFAGSLVLEVISKQRGRASLARQPVILK